MYYSNFSSLFHELNGALGFKRGRRGAAAGLHCTWAAKCLQESGKLKPATFALLRVASRKLRQFFGNILQFCENRN